MQRTICFGVALLSALGAAAWGHEEMAAPPEVAPVTLPAPGEAPTAEFAPPAPGEAPTAELAPPAEAAPPGNAAEDGGATQTAAAGKGPRDPFRPFTLDLRPNAEVDEPLTPLQQYELRQLTVTAVMWGLTPALAMLEDDTGMGFIVSPGTPIGRHGGTVKAIEPGRVVVEESLLDFYGNRQVNRVVLEIPREEETRTAKRE
jgi:type IV pilus assembly protein PilP